MFFSNSWLKATHELKKIGLMIVALLSGHLFGQQSYFNVPSSDKTEEGTWFFQQQTNFTSGVAVGNFTVDFGLKRDCELGVNLLQFDRNYLISTTKNVSIPKELNSPILSINAQKFIQVNSHVQFAIGGIAGANYVSSVGQIRMSYLGFSNMKLSCKILKFTMGVWTGNRGFVGSGRGLFSVSSSHTVGVQMGGELILGRNFSVIADHITGNTAISMSTLGLAQKISRNWILSCGIQMPNPNPLHPNGIVIELTRAL